MNGARYLCIAGVDLYGLIDATAIEWIAKVSAADSFQLFVAVPASIPAFTQAAKVAGNSDSEIREFLLLAGFELEQTEDIYFWDGPVLRKKG